MARIVRGQTMALKHREFIEAAHAFGASSTAIVRRHIIPNILGPVMVFVTLTVPQVILLESFLSFLGLGVQEPMTSWGVLIADGARDMETAPWSLLFPRRSWPSPSSASISSAMACAMPSTPRTADDC
jgi:oligopeptide transport system permease protein